MYYLFQLYTEDTIITYLQKNNYGMHYYISVTVPSQYEITLVLYFHMQQALQIIPTIYFV
jgi:hypothetical protein